VFEFDNKIIKMHSDDSSLENEIEELSEEELEPKPGLSSP
jgi:hypothetical protein